MLVFFTCDDYYGSYIFQVGEFEYSSHHQCVVYALIIDVLL